MPYELNWVANGVIAHFTGVLTEEETRWATADIFSDQRNEEIRFVILKQSIA